MEETTDDGVRLLPILGLASPNYRAGSDGRVYSCARGMWMPLEGVPTGTGYLAVTLTTARGQRETWLVHRLVCLAFHGLPAYPDTQVRHLDGNGHRNTPDNLAWGTARDNAHDRRRHELARRAPRQLSLPLQFQFPFRLAA